MTSTRAPLLLAMFAAGALCVPEPARAADYHHVHITAPSPEKGVEWYTRHLGCEPVADRTDAASCQGVELVFVPQHSLGNSQGTGIDHIGFSFADLTAKMAELEAVGVAGSGVRLQRFDDGSTLREVPGLFKLGFMFDPWGTRIELVEDPERLGFHHVHLSAADPDATLAWYRDVLGGEAASLKGRIDGVRFDGVWFLVSEHATGTPAPSADRSIDHIGFMVADLDGAAGDLRAQGVRFTEEPGVPDGGRTSAMRAFLAGPDNVRIAVVETGFAGVATELAATMLTADALGPYDAPRTTWGEPDLQGIYTSDAAAAVPFERPADVGADQLTPEEAVARQEARTLRGIWGYDREWRDITLNYERSVVSTQVAMVIDPPDGRLPPRTAEGRERAAARTERYRRMSEPAAGPEDRSLYDRCITKGLIAMPIAYNNGLQIVQGPGHVAITREMIHETRIIPTEPREPLGADLTQWHGVPQGRWEGDSLVIETSNLNGRVTTQGASPIMKLTERYTPIGPGALEYRFTVDDPATWTRPWTAMFRFMRDESQYDLVEYACHEGNYGMFNILSAARVRDAAAAAEAAAAR